MSLSVVIPAFNEGTQIGVVVDEIREVGAALVSEVIVVDDGSTDDTAAVAERHGARVVRMPRNGGYGAAVKAGLAHAASDFVLTLDGDGQHDPRDIRPLYDERLHADLVIGARPLLQASGAWRGLGKWLLRTTAEYLSRQRIPDLNSGLRLGRRDELARHAQICPDGFPFCDALAIVYLSYGKRVSFLPVEVRGRSGGESTIGIGTAFETALSILDVIMLFNPARIFLPASAVFVVAGFVWALPYFFMGRGLSVGGLLLILVGVLTFFFGLIAQQIALIRKELIARAPPPPRAPTPTPAAPRPVAVSERAAP